MARAGIFIGVDQSGELDKLHDAADGAARMRQWAVKQGMAESQAVLITDKDGKVTVDRIFDAVDGVLRGAGLEQLIVYFAGHGISINMSEHWLLSDAPFRRSAAIDVRLNAELAKECAAQYVVFISDACRVPPEGLQAQRVQGIEIFPNAPSAARAKPVDQFFACRLGMPATELPTPTEAVTAYKALYTGALLDALNGERPEVLEPSTEQGDDFLYLRPAKLDAWLESEVRRRIVKAHLLGKVNQSPEAYVVAQPKPVWLSRVPAARVTSTTVLIRNGATGAGLAEPETPRQAARRIVRSAVHGNAGNLGLQLLNARAGPPGDPAARADGRCAAGALWPRSLRDPMRDQGAGCAAGGR